MGSQVVEQLKTYELEKLGKFRVVSKHRGIKT